MALNTHPVDLGIFLVFLVVTLVVGLSHGRQSETIKDYALGGKNFSTLTLTATIIATWYGGGFLYYTLANVYSQGAYFFISALGAPLCLLIMGRLLAVRMQEFLNNVSAAEAMGDMYGKTVQVISAISAIAGRIGYLAVQFQVISRIVGLFLGGQNDFLTVVTATIVILYSTTGGIKAVTFTDVVQFFTFGTFLPIIALSIWGNLQNPHQVVEILTHDPKFSLRTVIGWNAEFINAIAIMLYFAIPGMNPPAFQRISMARNTKQVKNAFTYSALISLLITICVAWIGVLLLAENPHLEPSKLLNYLIDRYTYTGFKALLVTGVVALAMSSADSYINTCAVLFTNDVAAPLGFTQLKPILTARIFSLVLGTLALLLALRENDLLSLILLSGSFYMPIVSIPLLLSILGFRSSKRVVLISMGVGFSTVLLWHNFLAHTGINAVMPASLANLIALIGSHYLLGEPGGWQKVTPKIDRQALDNPAKYF